MYNEQIQRIEPNPELVLLASILHDNESLCKSCIQELLPEDFQDTKFRSVFIAIREKNSVDPTVLAEYMKGKSPWAMDVLMSCIDMAMSFLGGPEPEEYCKILKKRSFQKRLARAAEQLQAITNGNLETEQVQEQANKILQALTLCDQEKEPLLTEKQDIVFPIEVYPQWLQDVCTGYAKSISCPVEFLAASAIAVTSMVAGKKISLQIKPDWVEKARVYMAIVGHPSSGKSPAMAKMMSPIFKLEEQFKDENIHKEEAFDAAKLEYDLAKETWKKSRRDGNTQISPPPAPTKAVLRRAYTVDYTVESLGVILADDNDLLLYQDELSEWILKQNQYKGGKGNDKQFFLRNWQGSSCPIDRKGGKTLYLTEPYISVLGGIVPANIPLLKGKTHDGFIDRVLFAFPKERTKLWSDYSLSYELKEKYHSEIQRIYSMPVTILVLEEDAQRIFIEWHDYLANMIKLEPNQWISSAFGKMIGYSARFVLLLGAICGQTVIEKECVLGAIKLSEYFMANIRKVFSEIEMTQEQREVDAILSYASKRGLEQITVRAVTRAGVPGCKTAKEAKARFESLVSNGLANWILPGKEIRIRKVSGQPDSVG